MKKTDLKTGVVYYYNALRYTPRPAVLLETAIWRRTWSRSGASDHYVRWPHATKPETPKFMADTWAVGYLALLAPEGQPDTLRNLTLTPAEVIDEEGRPIPDVPPEGCTLEVVDNRHLAGEYDTRLAQIDEQKRREQAARDDERQRRREIVDRHNRIATTLNAVIDVPIRLVDEYDHPLGLSLSFEQAEQISAVLRREAQ